MASVRIEQRVAALEKELARLRNKMEQIDVSIPWWERIAGTFQDDPAYEKAMKLGRQYRRSIGQKADKREKKH